MPLNVPNWMELRLMNDPSFPTPPGVGIAVYLKALALVKPIRPRFWEARGALTEASFALWFYKKPVPYGWT